MGETSLSEVGDDPQAVINAQVGSTYDVFLGILWSRVGTPTPRAESGTIEEFERALSRHRNKERIEILMYFKNAPLAPDDIDVEQLASVQRFKRRLTDEGMLYASFTNVEDFEGLVRVHLSLLLQAWRSRLTPQPGIQEQQSLAPSTERPPQPELAQSPIADDEEPGFLDLIEAAYEQMAELTAGSERIAEATQTIGQQVAERADALNELSRSGKPSDVRAWKRITNLAAEDLERYSRQLRVELPGFSDHYQAAIAAFGGALGIAPEIDNSSFARKRLSGAIEALASMRKSLLGGRESMQGFRDTTASLPRMTTAFNRARKAAVETLDDFLERMDAALTQTTQAEDAARKLLE